MKEERGNKTESKWRKRQKNKKSKTGKEMTIRQKKNKIVD